MSSPIRTFSSGSVGQFNWSVLDQIIEVCNRFSALLPWLEGLHKNRQNEGFNAYPAILGPLDAQGNHYAWNQAEWDHAEGKWIIKVGGKSSNWEGDPFGFPATPFVTNTSPYVGNVAFPGDLVMILPRKMDNGARRYFFMPFNSSWDIPVRLTVASGGGGPPGNFLYNMTNRITGQPINVLPIAPEQQRPVGLKVVPAKIGTVAAFKDQNGGNNVLLWWCDETFTGVACAQ